MADDSRLDADRRKALGLAISQIEKQLGKGSIMRMGSDSARVKVAAIPTGAINLDAATGVGGIPRGRITEIYDKQATPMSEKTTDKRKSAPEGQENDDDQINTRRRGEIEPETEADNGHECESNGAGHILSDCTPESIVLAMQHELALRALGSLAGRSGTWRRGPGSPWPRVVPGARP